MVPDPFPLPHTASDLEASTAITPVTSDALDHAAKQAADLVEEVVHRSQTTTSGRRRAGGKGPDGLKGRPEDTAAPDHAMPEGGNPAERDAHDGLHVRSRLPQCPAHPQPDRNDRRAKQRVGGLGAATRPRVARRLRGFFGQNKVTIPASHVRMNPPACCNRRRLPSGFFAPSHSRRLRLPP